MKNKNIFGMLSVVLTLMVSLILVNQSVFAASPYNTVEEFVEHMEAECTRMEGTFAIIGEGLTSCTDIPVENMDLPPGCIPGTLGTEKGEFLEGQDPNNRITDSCYVDLGYEDTPVVPKEGMKKEGVAKIIYIPSEAYLGGTIKIEGMGAPSYLRLKADGVIYKLPVVPNSVNQLDDGTFVAEFYTIDPVTSQPLVAPGTYQADVFGENGTASASFQITISR
jgi:hypothetical protein